jgi:hypothetical protein
MPSSVSNYLGTPAYVSEGPETGPSQRISCQMGQDVSSISATMRLMKETPRKEIVMLSAKIPNFASVVPSISLNRGRNNSSYSFALLFV